MGSHPGDPVGGEVVTGAALAQWRQWACQQASDYGIPAEEVDWLLREGAGVERAQWRWGWPASLELACSLDQLTQWWQQRLVERWPVQYLVGHAPWRTFELMVTPAVLIPRPETELLIDLAVQAVGQSPQAEQLRRGRWVDVGTGSGAIALGLATAFPDAQIWAIDISAEALQVAQDNAARYGFHHSPPAGATTGDNNAIHFAQGHLLEPLIPYQGQIAGIVSNPPYIPQSLLADLQPEVRDHEPALALDGGQDGLEVLRQLVALGAQYLAPGGIWLVETMVGQPDAVVQLLRQEGHYTTITVHADLAGIDRFVLAYNSPEPAGG